MSDTATKAQEIRDRGALRRKTWTPEEGSYRLRIYRWWQKQSGEYRERENFCHFMRVVLFWAPLRWVAKPLLLALAVAVAVALVWAAVLSYQAVLPVVGVLLGVILALSASAVAHLIVNDDEFRKDWQTWTESRPKVLRGLVSAILFPFILFWKGVDRFVRWLVRLHDDYDLYGRVGRWLGGTKFSDSKWLSWIRPWLVFPLALVVLAIFYNWALIFLMIVVGAVALLGGIVLLAYLGEKADEALAKKREQQHRANIDRTLQVIFEVIHSDKANDKAAYAEWLEEYTDYCSRTWYRDGVYGLSVSDHIDQVWYDDLGSLEDIKLIHERLGLPLPLKYREKVEREALLRSLGATAIAAAHTVTPPSRWRRMWRTVRDGLRLVWAYILTLKWRTCHLVKIPDERKSV